MEPTELVTMADIRASRFCANGVREWCSRNGVDYRKLIRGQVTVAEMEVDELGKQITLQTRRRVEQEQT